MIFKEDKTATAKDTHGCISLGGGNYLYIPICRCWVESPSTGGTIYCPTHGTVRSSDILKRMVRGGRP